MSEGRPTLRSINDEKSGTEKYLRRSEEESQAIDKEVSKH